jgi:hypothetical protein
VAWVGLAVLAADRRSAEKAVAPLSLDLGRGAAFAPRSSSEERCEAGAQAVRCPSFTSTMTVSTRGYFSTRFLWTAIHLAASAGAIEHERPPELDAHFDIEHHGLVIAAVTAAAAFQEAMVTELFADANDGHGFVGDGYLAPLRPKTRHEMAQLWRETNGGERLQALSKYQLLLAFAGHDPLDRGTQPYQDAQLLVTLRNALIHYKPEDRPAFEETPHNMEKKLRGKFDDNPFMAGASDAWWPNHCFGYGCASWAYTAAVRLADRVCDDIGITPNYRRIMANDWGVLPAPGFRRP